MKKTDNERMNIKYVKGVLYYELGHLYKNKKNLEDIIWKDEVLQATIDLFNQPLDEIADIAILVFFQLEILLDDRGIIYSDRLKSLIDLYKYYIINSGSYENELADISLQYEQFKTELEEEYLQISITIDGLKKEYTDEKLKLCQETFNILKYRQKISPSHLSLIASILEKWGAPQIEVARICEEIELYNNSQIDFSDNDELKEEFFSMLYTGFEELPNLDLDGSIKKQLSYQIDYLLKSPSILKDKKSFEDYLVSSSFNAEYIKELCVLLLGKLQNEMLDIITMASSKDFYFDQEIKNHLLNEYNKLVDLYVVIRNHLDDQLKLTEEETIDNSLEDKYNIFFSKTSHNDDYPTYLEKDLKSIPEDYYMIVADLLSKKRKGLTNIKNDKPLSSNKNLDKIKELKAYEIRIIYQQLSDNNIIILGVAMKKADNDRLMYNNMALRPLNVDLDNDQELLTASESYERIQAYCQTNARKGKRK